jgi:hypothetical protein
VLCSGHRFDSNNRALNAAAQAAREHRSQLGADQRPAQELGNSYFGKRVPANIDRGSGELNVLPPRELMDIQTRSTGTANT